MPGTRTKLGYRSDHGGYTELYRIGNQYRIYGRSDDDESEQNRQVSKDEAMYLLEGMYYESQSRNGRYAAMGYDVGHSAVEPAGYELLAEVFGRPAGEISWPAPVD